MKTTLVRRTVDLFTALFFFAAIGSVVRLVAAFFSDDFGTISWPVQAEAVGTGVELADNASISFADGLLSVAGEPLAHALGSLASLVSLGLIIAALLLLRKVLSGFSRGEVLTHDNAARLRRIAWLLITVCGVSLIHAFALQPMILSAVKVPDGMVLHPSVSWDVKGASNIWLHYDPPLGTFLLGLLALLFSAAIQSGTEYRQDSESVI